MRNLHAYWQHIRGTQAELQTQYPDGAVPLTHFESGALSMVLPAVAARCIVDGSHRLASEPEIATWKERQAEEADAIGARNRTLARVNQKPRERSVDAKYY